MAFGWSFPKMMLVITLAFFLFGLPVMTMLMVARDRRRKESKNEPR